MKLSFLKLSFLPNVFTSLNLASGLISILLSSAGEYISAIMFIITAAVFDALDGLAARITRTSSGFGVQLDSLADMVSFGAAPAVLLYTSFLHKFEYFGYVIAGIYVICGAFRLARFNTQLVGFDKSYFIGFPIPSAAITIASFYLIYFKNGEFSEPYSGFLIPLTLGLSFLMISRIKYDTIPRFSRKALRENPLMIIFFGVSVLLVIISRGQWIFYIFLAFILMGILKNLFAPESFTRIKEGINQG